MTGQTITVGDFIELISRTEISEAAKWLEGFRKDFPAITWDSFCQQTLNPERLISIVKGIWLRIISDFSNIDSDFRYVLRVGIGFIMEIFCKASACGVILEGQDEDTNKLFGEMRVLSQDLLSREAELVFTKTIATRFSEVPENSYFVIIVPGKSSLLLCKGSRGQIRTYSDFKPLASQDEISPDTEVQLVDIRRT